MVRINLIEPWRLSDQHLIAEYNEILMLIGYVKKHPKWKGSAPAKYCLGKGHVSFFRDKVGYLRERHDEIREEMKRRGFRTEKYVKLRGLGKAKKWKPCRRDKGIIKRRLIGKIRQKPGFYRYYGKRKSQNFLIGLIKKG